jgi:hypothetical protein
LGIASGVLLAVALIVLPSVNEYGLELTMNANGSAAIAVLKNLSAAQAQMQASAAVDDNHNGAGEYATFAQLAAAHLWRPAESGRQLSPTRLEYGGYVYELVLPAAPAERETLWTCYAWPAAFARSGNRTFVITQGGDILSSRTRGRYDGDRGPTPGRSGFCSRPQCTSRVAANTIDDEGDRWTVV